MHEFGYGHNKIFQSSKLILTIPQVLGVASHQKVAIAKGYRSPSSLGEMHKKHKKDLKVTIKHLVTFGVVDVDAAQRSKSPYQLGFLDQFRFFEAFRV